MYCEMQPRSLNKLLWAITSLGLDNISAISNYSGIPLETTRYMIWHELSNHRVSAGVDVDFGKIGLTQWMLEIKKIRNSDIEPIISFLNGGIGLTYLPSVMACDSIIAFVAIPGSQNYKLEALLEYLVSIKVIQNYSMEKIRFIRHVSFDPSHYDFGMSRWGFDWNGVDALNSKTIRRPSYTSSSDKSNQIVDYKDLLILREFQRRAPRSISKLAGVLESDPFNVRYHYNKHAKSAIRGYYLKVMPRSTIDEQSLFMFVYEPLSEQDLEGARRIALSLPFTTMEWQTQEKYAWSATWPGEYTNAAFRYLDQMFGDLQGQLKHFMIDSKTEPRHTIPCEMFDENAGRWNFEPRISLHALQRDFEFVKSTCKYQVSGLCR